MKLFNYIIQHKNDYIDNLIVDSEYTMTEEDEKDYKYKVIGEYKYQDDGSNYEIKVYHSQAKYSDGPYTISESTDDSYYTCQAKILAHHSLKDIITWHKWKVRTLYKK